MARLQRENVMLCYPADDGRVSRMGDKFFVQPKLNGERCRIEWFHGEPVMLSSYGNIYKGLEHIQEQLCALALATGRKAFDGELYVHGWSWSQIRSVASREVNAHPRAKELQYHIFDTQEENRPQVLRLIDLKHGFEEVEDNCPNLVLVPTYTCEQGEQWEYCNKFVDDGYEGIIMRRALEPYYPKRNVCILKFKPTESDEYEIVETLEAVAEDGTPKGMVGAFLVKSDDNVVFKVGAGKLKHPRRIVLWEKRQKLTGLLLIVKHEKMATVGGVPVAAVTVDVKGA